MIIIMSIWVNGEHRIVGKEREKMVYNAFKIQSKVNQIHRTKTIKGTLRTHY